MGKTKQIMSLDIPGGAYYVCILDNTAKYNPYKLYKKWYNLGWHREKIVEYADLLSVLLYIAARTK